MENIITCRPVKPHHLFWKRNCRFTADTGFRAKQCSASANPTDSSGKTDKRQRIFLSYQWWDQTWWGLWFYPSVWKSQGILPYFFLSLDYCGGYCQRKLPQVKLRHQLHNLMTISKWKINISWKMHFNIKERVKPSANKRVAKDLYKFHPLWWNLHFHISIRWKLLPRNCTETKVIWCMAFWYLQHIQLFGIPPSREGPNWL